MFKILVCLLSLAVGASAGAGTAIAASIEGSWDGGGTVKLASGEDERVRCRVRYEQGTGRTFVLYATCAHSNGTFEQSGRVVQLSDNRYSGRLYSDQYSVSGDVSISVSGNRQTISAVSAKGTATLVLTRR